MLQPLPNKAAPIPVLRKDREVSEALLIWRWIFGERKDAAFGRHIRAILAACVTGLILMAFWAPSAVAWDKYGDGCDTCHGAFDSGNYTSNKDATSWGTDLMDGHLSFISGGGRCDFCHSGTDRTSVRTNLSDDPEKSQSCVGCHGRVGDESGICAFGTPDNDGEHCGSAAGLRNVHNTAGITTCFGCHINDDGAVLVGENELPFNYGLTGIDLSSPCVAENKFGPTGLDNDGDGAVDAADTDCSPTGDSDGDGVPDDQDAFPNDPTEWEDTDGDGIGNNADPDDDNDGVPDAQDDFPLGRFDDAPPGYWAFTFIEALARAGITAGCGGSNYCPLDAVTRAQMAVFLERGMRGSGFSPPPATGNVFLDVGAGDFAASFIEQLFLDGITAGCGNNNYCPNTTVTRDQMAVFLLRAKHGAGYSPPAATGIFGDVPLSYWAVNWIEQLAAEGVTAGCGGGNYCPEAPVNRDQMAVFLVRTFGL